MFRLSFSAEQPCACQSGPRVAWRESGDGCAKENNEARRPQTVDRIRLAWL